MIMLQRCDRRGATSNEMRIARVDVSEGGRSRSEHGSSLMRKTFAQSHRESSRDSQWTSATPSGSTSAVTSHAAKKELSSTIAIARTVPTTRGGLSGGQKWKMRQLPPSNEGGPPPPGWNRDLSDSCSSGRGRGGKSQRISTGGLKTPLGKRTCAAGPPLEVNELC